MTSNKQQRGSGQVGEIAGSEAPLGLRIRWLLFSLYMAMQTEDNSKVEGTDRHFMFPLNIMRADIAGF